MTYLINRKLNHRCSVIPILFSDVKQYPEYGSFVKWETPWETSYLTRCLIISDSSRAKQESILHLCKSVYVGRGKYLKNYP